LSDDGQAGLKEKKDEAASDAVTGSSGEKAADKNELGNDPAHPLATEGTYNTFYGTGAGASNSGDENRNSFFGAGAGYYTSSGVQNTFLGYNAASDNTTGSYNTFVGAYAGDGNHAGSNNTFVGKNAGVFNYDAGGNTFMGASSGYATSSGSNNTFIGLEAGYMNTSGAGNTFVGVGSGYNNNASHNIFLGRYAGYNATGSRNVFLGSESGYNETGDDKLYIDNSNTTTPLIYGEFATDVVRINGLFAVTGTTSLTDTTVQGNLTVSDSISLDSGSTTISAPEINMLDGKTLATGAAGNDMLVTKGYVDESDDVGGGLTGNEMTDTYLCKWDDTNTRLVNSLLSETPEAVNINGRLGIGTPSPSGNLEVVTTGSNNVLAVTRTDGASFKLSAMGASGQIGTITAHPVNFMASNVKRLTISVNGNIGIGVTVPTYPLHMASGAYCSTGGVWTNSSSLALKENIASLSPEKAAAALQELRPVIYNYKADKAESCIGFIAEEVPELVSMNDRKSLSPMDIVAVLTKVVQEQQKAISALQRQVADLEKRSPEKMK